MENKHLILLKKLVEKRDEKMMLDSPYNILIHSVLNNIKLERLITYYINFPDHEIKNSIYSNISNRVILAKNPKQIYCRFYKELESSKYTKRQRIRNILLTLLPRLSKIYYEDYFNTFYYSQYLNDKKSAITIFSKISDQKHHEIILKDYFETLNEIYLTALINDNAVMILSANIEEIWNTEPKSYLKRLLITLLYKNHMLVLNFLKLKDAKHHLFLQCLSKDFDQNMVLQSFNEIPKCEQHFAIYNMSKKLQWNELENQITKYVQ